LLNEINRKIALARG